MEMGTFGKFRVGNVEVDVDQVFENVRADRSEKLWEGATLATVFTSQSVRTRTSFERAAIDLDMRVISVLERRDGEPLRDFGYAIAQICDVCVSRLTGDDDLSEFARDVSIPFIDGGCGTASHPTQAIIDVFTLLECGIPIGSSISLFGPETNRCMKSFIELAGRQFELVPFVKDYRVEAVYCVSFGNHQTLPSGLECKVLHPFPRSSVIPHEYDFTEQDLYHVQMKNAVRVRKEILCAVL